MAVMERRLTAKDGQRGQRGEEGVLDAAVRWREGKEVEK